MDSLNIMEAYVSLMKLENVRILKEMRNSVNRKVTVSYTHLDVYKRQALRPSAP